MCLLLERLNAGFLGSTLDFLQYNSNDIKTIHQKLNSFLISFACFLNNHKVKNY